MRMITLGTISVALSVGCIALALIGAGLLVGCGAQPPTEFDRYKQDCQAKAGYMTVTRPANWTENARYQCIGAQGPLMPEVMF